MVREVTPWWKPTSDMFKLNVDESYHGDEGEEAAGAAIRDANGDFIAGSCSFRRYHYVSSCYEAWSYFRSIARHTSDHHKIRLFGSC